MNITEAITAILFAATLWFGFGNNIVAGLQAQAHGVASHQEDRQ